MHRVTALEDELRELLDDIEEALRGIDGGQQLRTRISLVRDKLHETAGEDAQPAENPRKGKFIQIV